MRRRKAMIIGYGRTSTFDQAAGLAAQERDLKAAGADEAVHRTGFQRRPARPTGRVPGLPA